VNLALNNYYNRILLLFFQIKNLDSTYNYFNKCKLIVIYVKQHIHNNEILITPIVVYMK